MPANLRQKLIHPVKKVHITQKWGNDLIINGKHVYAQWGYKGHNGVDYRLHDKNGVKASSGRIIAPHGGVVKEIRFDKKGYGWYFKIENDEMGSVLAHLKENSIRVKEGQKVTTGQWVADGNNSGFSTAPHLHWGWYLFPRNRRNGYGGTIDPIPYITNMADDSQEVHMPDSGKIELDKNKFEELISKSSRYDEFVKAGFDTYQKVQTRFNDLQKSLSDKKEELGNYQKLSEQCRKDLKELVAELARLLDTRQETVEVIGAVSRAVRAEDKLNDELNLIAKEREAHAKTVQDLMAEVAYWKELAKQGDVLAQIRLEDLLKEIITRLTGILK